MSHSTASEQHLIFGTGPAACWTARHLRAKGLTVKAVNRSGQRPGLMPSDVAIIQADLSQEQQAIDVTQGASVVYQALGPAYSQWAELFPQLQANTIQAAICAKARYVALENLYMVEAEDTITESSPDGPCSVKGEVRMRMHRDLMESHLAGDLQISVLRASDYYGPGVTASSAGERLFGNLVKSKAAQVMVRDDCLHSFAYIEDVGRGLAALGTAPLPPVPLEHHAAEHAALAGARGGGAHRLAGIRRMPEVGQDPQTALFQFSGLGIFVLVDHVLLGAVLHQLQRLGLHPGAHEGGEIQAGVAVEHQVVVHQLIGQIRLQALVAEPITRHLIGQRGSPTALAEMVPEASPQVDHG